MKLDELRAKLRDPNLEQRAPDSRKPELALCAGCEKPLSQCEGKADCVGLKDFDDGAGARIVTFHLQRCTVCKLQLTSASICRDCESK